MQGTVRQFLQAALQPIGQTMYVWGGGWNAADTGAGASARTHGISPRWAAFAARQTSDYDFRHTGGSRSDGLDCSGFVGWAVYQMLGRGDGAPGYVFPSGEIGGRYAAMGLGMLTPAACVRQRQAGDIMDRQGHVYLVIGACADGSLVILQSSPPGVQLFGTAAPDGRKGDAVQLAAAYMKRWYPAWQARFPNSARGADYLTAYNRFAWHRTVLDDPEHLTQMNAKQVLATLYKEERWGAHKKVVEF